MRVRRQRRPRPSRRPAADRFRRATSDRFRRGIYLIPSLFTVGNMFCGFAAVLHALNGRLELAGWLILLAGVLDGLDGRIARLTHSSSDFGKEYDSLADVVSFGVAPAVLVYLWGLRDTGRWGWAVAFLFLVAGSVRLARFNVHAHEGDRRFFTGLPIPGGAGAVTLMVLVHPQQLVEPLHSVVVWIFVFLVSVLMVSTVPYRSYKDFNLRQRWPATAFFLIALIVAVIAVSPPPALAIIAAGYLLSGPLVMLLRALRRQPPANLSEPPEASHAAASPADTEHP
ncbi:MAG: CDP-diacylglycerol--serine O-phosphatidyltransferase [Acidobacteriota bacterium]